MSFAHDEKWLKMHFCHSTNPPPLFFSPSGKKFRSKPQLARYLGNTVDLGCFDFRTGKMMPGKLQKNKQRLRHDLLSLAKVTLQRFLGGELSFSLTEVPSQLWSNRKYRENDLKWFVPELAFYSQKHMWYAGVSIEWLKLVLSVWLRQLIMSGHKQHY